MGAILTLVGVLITAILLVKKVKGGILYGILITWVLGILCELTGIYIPNPDAGMYSVIPTSFISFDFSALGNDLWSGVQDRFLRRGHPELLRRDVLLPLR